MKTVTIPNDYKPYEIEVNGVKYTFPAGSTQAVPDEVAAVIENRNALEPKEYEEPVPVVERDYHHDAVIKLGYDTTNSVPDVDVTPVLVYGDYDKIREYLDAGDLADIYVYAAYSTTNLGKTWHHEKPYAVTIVSDLLTGIVIGITGYTISWGSSGLSISEDE